MISHSLEELFDRKYLEQLRALHLISRQKMRGRLKAERRSTEKGSSLEFEDYRPYTFGDDLRMIDWKVYARWRHLVVKLFVEEQDLYLHLLLDTTASMDWGSPNKFDVARRLLAGFAYLGLTHLDRVGVYPLGLDPGEASPPKRGEGQFLPMLRRLSQYRVSTQARSLEDVVYRWTLQQPRRGKVILVSDLFGQDWEDARRAIDRLRYQRHEIAVLQVSDKEESLAGEYGEYRMEDCEYGVPRVIAVDPRVEHEYQKKFERYQEEMGRYCARYQIPLIRAWTIEEPWDLFMKAFREGGFIR